MKAIGKLLICPICKSGLKAAEASNTYQCMNKHTFDIARQGYVNLLTSNQKSSKAPGDSREMVQARKAFLEKGYYEPLSDHINLLVAEGFKNASGAEHTLLDIGCGEGYYLSRLLRSPAVQAYRPAVYGLDISKDAVKNAASAVKAGNWIVGNSHFIPLKGGSFQCILSVFSPILSSEISRLLRPEGLFLRVLPGPEHLLEIRKIIYPQVIQGPEKTQVESYPELTFLREESVRYQIVLDGSELSTLVKMTPHFWKTTKADKAKLDALTELTVTIDMRILIYGKNKEAQHVQWIQDRNPDLSGPAGDQ